MIMPPVDKTVNRQTRRKCLSIEGGYNRTVEDALGPFWNGPSMREWRFENAGPLQNAIPSY